MNDESGHDEIFIHIEIYFPSVVFILLHASNDLYIRVSVLDKRLSLFEFVKWTESTIKFHWPIFQTSKIALVEQLPCSTPHKFALYGKLFNFFRYCRVIFDGLLIHLSSVVSFSYGVSFVCGGSAKHILIFTDGCKEAAT